MNAEAFLDAHGEQVLTALRGMRDYWSGIVRQQEGADASLRSPLQRLAEQEVVAWDRLYSQANEVVARLDVPTSDQPSDVPSNVHGAQGLPEPNGLMSNDNPYGLNGRGLIVDAWVNVGSGISIEQIQERLDSLAAQAGSSAVEVGTARWVANVATSEINR
jgi:hypothetical protein